MDTALTNCRSAIVGVTSYKTGNHHYVLVVRKNGNDYDILDPMGYRSTKLSDYIVTNAYSKNIDQVISF